MRLRALSQWREHMPGRLDKTLAYAPLGPARFFRIIFQNRPFSRTA